MVPFKPYDLLVLAAWLLLSFASVPLTADDNNH